MRLSGASEPGLRSEGRWHGVHSVRETGFSLPGGGRIDPPDSIDRSGGPESKLSAKTYPTDPARSNSTAPLPRSHAPRGNASPDALRRRTARRASRRPVPTETVSTGISHLSFVIYDEVRRGTGAVQQSFPLKSGCIVRRPRTQVRDPINVVARRPPARGPFSPKRRTPRRCAVFGPVVSCRRSAPSEPGRSPRRLAAASCGGTAIRWK